MVAVIIESICSTVCTGLYEIRICAMKNLVKSLKKKKNNSVMKSSNLQVRKNFLRFISQDLQEAEMWLESDGTPLKW